MNTEEEIQSLKDRISEVEAKNYALYTMIMVYMSWDQTIGQAGYDQINEIYGETLEKSRQRKSRE